ncbi:hypothetical protein OG992_33735 [Micromonospora sp. NBC_00362]|uniref:hypothetical protein n=1 Tax=Micromonospora sp. NBC_00362 TaxID=2975975 RepID=UPI0022551D1B|nr:hypothetical protein [Micromonospora sp. NBC_00362]MCX5122119.1 hypothetical protein [Micromonospora sp. NBC_00362]
MQRDLFAARTALACAADAFDVGRALSTGGDVAACAAVVARLDAVAERLHGLLRRVSA